MEEYKTIGVKEKTYFELNSLKSNEEKRLNKTLGWDEFMNMLKKAYKGENK